MMKSNVHGPRVALGSLGLALLLGLPCGQVQAGLSLVATDAGLIEGRLAEDGTQAYLGVPFAAPPVGDLRWKAPQAPLPWQGVRPAHQPGAACLQDASLPLAGMPDSSEDCLYLNVHVPDAVKPAAGQAGGLPVMVFLHPGVFVMGAGSQYDGGELAKAAKAIVVTVNYRLGMLGSLALPALQAEAQAGNLALQDQQAALRWVQRNIAGFGGDAARVTLFGESAGGASICHQLTSPGAKGLFQRAIIQSGPCTSGTLKLADAQALGQAFADKLGCPAGPAQMNCLRSKPAGDLLRAQPMMDFADLSSLLAFNPYIDGVIVPAPPKELIRSGAFHRMPVMMGSNKDEARLFVAMANDIAQGAPLTEAAFAALVKSLAGSDFAASIMTSFYSSKRQGSPNLAASALITDVMYACDAQRTARMLSGKTPTYAYEFQHQDVPPLYPDPFMAWGAYHGAELPVLFMSRIQTSPPSPDPRDAFNSAQRRLAAQMAGYWGRFAATGDPNGGDGVRWPRFDALSVPTQQLTTTAITTDYLGGVYGRHQCLLWDTVAALGMGM